VQKLPCLRGKILSEQNVWGALVKNAAGESQKTRGGKQPKTGVGIGKGADNVFGMKGAHIVRGLRGSPGG